MPTYLVELTEEQHFHVVSFLREQRVADFNTDQAAAGTYRLLRELLSPPIERPTELGDAE